MTAAFREGDGAGDDGRTRWARCCAPAGAHTGLSEGPGRPPDTARAERGRGLVPGVGASTSSVPGRRGTDCAAAVLQIFQGSQELASLCLLSPCSSPLHPLPSLPLPPPPCSLLLPSASCLTPSNPDSPKVPSGSVSPRGFPSSRF